MQTVKGRCVTSFGLDNASRRGRVVERGEVMVVVVVGGEMSWDIR
jgi:hypothetical protein